ncbi:MAG: hypothetical protein AAFR04_11270, partial [Pseudomonadota bacterium]
MASVICSQSRNLLVAFVVTLCLFRSDIAPAQQAGPLPDYVIKEFGQPPAVPKGPFSPELQAAVQTALIDSSKQKTWGRDQAIALAEIAKSRDPRVAWVISDLMRFMTSSRLNTELAKAASALLDIKLPTTNKWGKITN